MKTTIILLISLFLIACSSCKEDPVEVEKNLLERITGKWEVSCGTSVDYIYITATQNTLVYDGETFDATYTSKTVTAITVDESKTVQKLELEFYWDGNSTYFNGYAEFTNDGHVSQKRFYGNKLKN